MTTTTEFNEADLPELPSPEYEHVFPSGGYSRTQMDAYALAAVAAYRKKLVEQEPVFEVGFGWLDDATKYPRGTKLYAAPMPQANESEAVKTLRRVVSNYETNCSVRDAWAWHEDSYNAARAVLAGEPGAQEKGHDE